MNMKLELYSASNFLVHLIRLAKRNVGESQLQKFRDTLIGVLQRRYKEHWFPEKPFKGSGYRCIRINGKMDPVIGQAGESCGLSSAFLHSTFPSELTMWIDPKEVSYRIGENGSICVLYEYSEGVNEPWVPASFRNNKNSSSKCVENKPEPNSTTHAPSTPSCKDSLRMDYLLDPKKSVSIEQLAALVSS
jgi:protein Tob/BTG